IANACGGTDELRFAGCDRVRVPGNRLDRDSVCVDDGDLVFESLWGGVFISNLRFGGDLCTATLDVEILCVCVDARRSEILIKRQCWIETIGDVEEDVLIDAAVVGVEISIVPLVS